MNPNHPDKPVVYYIDHEIRLRHLQSLIERVDNNFKEIKSLFFKAIGTIIVTAIIPIVLHYYGIV